MIHVDVSPTVLLCVGGLYALLIVASLAVFFLRWRTPDQDRTELGQRIRSWWIIVGLFTVAIVSSRLIAIAFFAFVSFLALKEYLSIVPTRRADRRVLFWAYLSIPLQYYWVAQAWYGMFVIFIPVYVFLWLSMCMVIVGETKEFLHAAGTLHWGHDAGVWHQSRCLFAGVATGQKSCCRRRRPGIISSFSDSIHDVAQYCWGKLLGRHKIVPKVSPNKTWEGFLGGVATTASLAALLASALTPMDWRVAIVAGLLIGCAGFVGDVTISALKRDIGLKDTGNLLPGHGGDLDRIDSLTYTAPLFFHFIHYLYY